MCSQKSTGLPQRSCLGCRGVKDKHLLIRFVLSPDNEVLPDLDSKLPGRGAYTCLHKDCLVKAVTHRQFKRAFRQEVSVMPPEALAGHIERLLRDRIMSLVGLANKAGKVVGGGSLVSEALKGRIKPGLVLVATDSSESIGDKIIALANVHHIPNYRISLKDDFGLILGKAPRSALAVKPCGFVAQLAKAIDRYSNFLGEA